MMDLFDALQKEKFTVQSAADAAQVVGWVHSGNYALNWALSDRFDRGWPLGHVAEIFGEEGTGKSYLAYRAIAECQRAGGGALLDDVEAGFNPEWAERALGVRADQLPYYTSPTVEEHYELIRTFAEAVDKHNLDGPFVLVLDSLASLSTVHEMESAFTTPDMGRAKQIHRLFREMGLRLSKLPVVYLLTNHVIDTMSNWGSAITTPGGRGPKYQSSLRIHLRNVRSIRNSSKEEVGVGVRVKVVKSRLTTRGREVEIIIPFHHPISIYSGLIPVLLDAQVVAIKGHNLTFEGKDTGIKAHKTDPIRQQDSAAQLLDSFPIIDAAHDVFKLRVQLARLPNLSIEEPNNGGEEAEGSSV